MTVGQKVSVSLLIAVVLFAGFAALAFTGLFELVEARFYNPTIAKGLERELAADAAVTGSYFSELTNRFASELAEGAVKRSFLPNQSAEDVFERSRRFGLLMEGVSGLQSVRFIDLAGKRIHFSTARGDELRRDRLSIAYRNYGEAEGDLPFETVAAPEGSSSRIIVDAASDRFLFVFPFLDSFNVYKGTAIFSVSIRGLAERLTTEGRLRVGEELALVAQPAGAVAGFPRVGREALVAAVASVWSDGTFGPTPLASGGSGNSYALISAKTTDGFITGRLVNENVFAFPPAMKAILLASFFLTVYLVVFLIFNLRQDSLTVIRDRIKRFQLALMEEYYDRKGDLDWNRWRRELEIRREEVRAELKRDLSGTVPKRLTADVDELIDKSWDELLTAIGGRMGVPVTAQIDEGHLQDILGRVMALAPAAAPTPSAGKSKGKKAPTSLPPMAAEAPVPSESPAEMVEAVEELEEIGDAEEVTEGEEVEAVEELEEIPEAEEAEAVEAEGAEELEEAEAVEDLEEVEEAEEIDEAEAVEDLEEIEEVESVEAEEAEELEAAEVVEDLEEVEEAEEVQEVESAEEAEGVAEATAVAEAEENAEAAEAIEEAFAEAEQLAEPEEIPEAEAAESIDEAEETTEAEPLAEPEEIPEAEVAEAIDEAEETTEAEPLVEPEEIPEAEGAEVVAESFEEAEPLIEPGEPSEAEAAEAITESFAEAEQFVEPAESQEAEDAEAIAESFAEAEPLIEPEEVPEAETAEVIAETFAEAAQFVEPEEIPEVEGAEVVAESFEETEQFVEPEEPLEAEAAEVVAESFEEAEQFIEPEESQEAEAAEAIDEAFAEAEPLAEPEEPPEAEVAAAITEIFAEAEQPAEPEEPPEAEVAEAITEAFAEAEPLAEPEEPPAAEDEALEELEEAELAEDLGEIEQVQELEEVEAGGKPEVVARVERASFAEGLEVGAEELEEIEPAEELEEIEAVEELEEIGEAEEFVGLEDFDAELSKSMDLDRIASAIEFAPMPVKEDEGLLPELEVVSPFEGMLSSLNEQIDNAEAASIDSGEASEATENIVVNLEDVATLEPLEPLLKPYRLFSSPPVEEIEALEPIGDEEEGAAELLAEEDEAIELHDGIPYVSQSAGEAFLDADRFDPDLWELVDSVIDRKG